MVVPSSIGDSCHMSVEPVTQLSVAGLVAQIAQGPARLLRVLRRLPATLGYSAALAAVALVTSRLPTATRADLVADASTNLHNLAGGRVLTLITSAFVTDGTPAATWWLALAALMAVIELSWGSWSAIGVFAAGHVGATAIVAVGLAIGVRHGWAAPAVSHAVDVGISYGVMALVGAVVAGLPATVRPLWIVSWVPVTVAGVINRGDFTSAGHLCALAIGLLIGGVVLLRESRRQLAGRRT